MKKSPNNQSRIVIPQDPADLGREHAHPKALRVLNKEWYWDQTDGNSPFGNDRGNDTFKIYRQWRRDHPKIIPTTFLRKLLKSSGITIPDWKAVDEEKLKASFATHGGDISSHDDVVLGLAFAQIVLEGYVHPDIKERAVTAITRQALPAVIEWRGWVNAKGRSDRLFQMRQVLELDWDQTVLGQ